MKTFRKVFDGKMADREFKSLFNRECHVCGNTIRIFAELLERGVPLEKVAEDLKTDLESIQNLETADFCDPHLVVRICTYLDLPPPGNCPRMALRDESPQ